MTMTMAMITKMNMRHCIGANNYEVRARAEVENLPLVRRLAALITQKPAGADRRLSGTSVSNSIYQSYSCKQVHFIATSIMGASSRMQFRILQGMCRMDSSPKFICWMILCLCPSACRSNIAANRKVSHGMGAGGQGFGTTASAVEKGPGGSGSHPTRCPITRSRSGSCHRAPQGK